MSLDPSDLQAWPFREAQQLRERLDTIERGEEGTSKKSKVIFETGFGPSGLPHIGTFGEVARTNWVRRAFEYLVDGPTELIAFSDDMDGLRGIPDNVPEAGMLRENLGRPLCDVPDPFGESESFSGHMNDALISFLDRFGFEYTFRSSKEQYRNGVFDEGLQRILDRYDEVRETVTRTLREHNRAAWSPFMPICEECGRISTTRVVDVDPGAGEVSYVCDRDFRARQGDQRIPGAGLWPRGER